jgi:UDP-4-amino-4,6-dideoxy-N-acetyl-beta-L-altrosamine N-acetyltransferase
MIELVKMEESDLKTMMHWRMLPEVTKYMFTDPELTMKMQIKWFDEINNDPTCKHWIINYNKNNIGTVNLTNIDYQNSRCSWGYYIADTSLRGKGIGKLLEYNIFDFVFTELDLNKLISEVLAFNERVVTIKEKCGSKIEGVLRKHIKKGNIYHDVVVMAILREEWLDQRAGIDYEKISIDKS